MEDLKTDQIAENLQRVRDRIAAAARRAGRDPSAVRLVAVTKAVGVAEAQALVDLGVKDLGENRLEQAVDKIERVGGRPVWHMIGNVQRRKVRDIVERFDTIDAVDRLNLAEEIEKRCAAVDKVMPVLLEVNVSGEESKHGFRPDEVKEALDRIAEMPQLRVDGVMTMAPFESEPEATRPVFAALNALAVQHGLDRISMGMTNDFEVAIEEGATEVRIGTALFQS